MDKNDLNRLVEKTRWLRLAYLDMVMSGGQGHIPSGFSMAEILVALYYSGFVNYRHGEPLFEDRDRVIISKGHAAPILYPILADIGYFDSKELRSFTKEGGLLSMYPDPKIPGIECVSGSLGHGIGLASGILVGSNTRQSERFRTYVVIGDGECYEGSVWESAFFAAANKISALTVIVDANQYCILGSIEECLTQGNLTEKWRSFGWDTYDVNGHSFQELNEAFIASSRTDMPSVIVARTLKGKGVSFMEGRHLWHNRVPNEHEYILAKEELMKGGLQ